MLTPRLHRLLIIGSVLLALGRCGLALAQPVGVTRVLTTIDFEERRLGNAEDLPMHWMKVQGEGLPHYVNGKLSNDQHRSGEYSFRFDLNGGSLVYRYQPGQIRVTNGAHYRVAGYVKTTVAPNARARITAYFTDIDGHPLASSMRQSELYVSPRPDEPWHELSTEVYANDPNAAWLVVELAFLQPMHYAPDVLGKRSLFAQDIRATAWFDDITISQVPQVHMTTERPGNIFRRGDPLRLNVVVNDRFTDDLSAQLVITDAQGRAIYQRSGAGELSTAQNQSPGQKKLALTLPQLPAGWYEVSLVMSSQGSLVGDQKLDIVLLADDKDYGITDDRFGVIATDLPFEGWSQLPYLLPLLGTGRVKLAVWSNKGDVQQIDPLAFDQMLVKFQELHITPTACLLDLPPTLLKQLNNAEGDDPSDAFDAAVDPIARLARVAATGADGEPGELGHPTSSTNSTSWLKLLKAPRELWQPQLAYLIARHANHLDRWQLGDDGSDAFVTHPAMRQVYDRVKAEFAPLVRNPDLSMPWPAWYELSGELPATVALAVPPSVLPSQLPLYMQDIRGHAGHKLSLSLQLLDVNQYGRETQIMDLAQRIIYALSADAQRIDIPLSFTVKRSGSDLVQQPQELFMIMRTLVTTLSSTVYRGRVPISDGIEAFLFDRNGEGILALWDTGKAGPDGLKELPINLGEHPMRVDLWGNVTPLLRAQDDKEHGRVLLSVGRMPILLTDIDAALAQFRASVALDQPLIESSFRPHTRHIHFTSHYRTAMSGSVKLTPPPGWTINPSVLNFSLNPGETLDRELTIEFPYNSFAGAKTIDAQFAIQADRATNFHMPVLMQLGLSDVGMQTMALRDGKDVVVQQFIQNYGEKPIDYTAFAIVAGQARQERLVTALAPGRTVIKRYRFQNVPASPDGKVRVGVKELDGTRILNDEVPIQ